MAFSKKLAIKSGSGSGDLTVACEKLNLLLLEKLFKLFTKLGAADMEAFIVVLSDAVIITIIFPFQLSFIHNLSIEFCNLFD